MRITRCPGSLPPRPASSSSHSCSGTCASPTGRAEPDAVSTTGASGTPAPPAAREAGTRCRSTDPTAGRARRRRNQTRSASTRSSRPRSLSTARCRPTDRGSVTLEITLAIPLLVMLVFVLVGALRLANATVDVNAAAGAASRSASLARTPGVARTAAHATATANLDGRCTSLDVNVDTSAFGRGGSVTVTVRCTVPTRGLTGLKLPGSVTSSASSTSPIDVYRSDTLAFANPDGSSGRNRSGGAA